MADNIDKIRSQMAQERTMVDKITQPTTQLNLINKVNEVIDNIVVDDALSLESENPVQNKVVTSALETKLETIKVNGTAQTVSSGTVDISIPAAQTVGDGDMVLQRNGSAVGTFTANQTSASTINISVPTQASDIGALPDSTTIGDANLVIQRNGSSVGTFGANATTASTINISVPTQASDIGALPDSTTIGSGKLTIKRNGTSIGTFNANQTTNMGVDISVPTAVSELTNDSGFISGISSSDVTTALGYTPYSNANPSGYQANVIETVKVNGTALTPTSKSVNISIPDAQTVDQTYSASSTNAQSGVAVAGAIDGLIKKTDLSIASNSANYLSYNNSNGQFGAKVDTTVTASSTNLITSGAVEAAIGAAIVGGVMYQGTWTATSQTDYSSITLPVKKGYLYYVTGSATVGGIEWNTGDFLLIDADVDAGGTISNVTKIDNTESADIVRLDAAQTLTNKTIDADDNTISDLTTSNFKSGTLSDSVRATASAATTVLVSEKGIADALAGKYDSSNPSGYQANVIETVKVNGTALSVSSKAVDITVPSVGNGNMVIQKNGTAVGTFTANQSSAKTINISVPTTAADVSALPDTTVIGEADLVIQRNSTAIGTFGANATSAKTINISVPTTASDVGALPDSTTIGEGKVTIKRNGTAIGTINVNATANSAIDVTVPTVLSALTNDSGYITGSDLADYQTTSNLVTSLSASSTDTQYPSAKCVYDNLSDKQAKLTAGTDLEIINTAEYVQLTYIQSTGTQYIDTGIKADSDYEIRLVFTTPSTLVNGSLFGNQSSDILLYLQSGKIDVYNNNNKKATINTVLTANTTYTIILNVTGTTATISGDLSGTFSSITRTGTYNILLGANHNASGNITDFGQFKYTNARIFKDGTKVFDATSEKRSSDDALGMFDSVSRTFKTNAGTGVFIAGEEIPGNTQTIRFTNDSGYITSISSNDVTTALGYTPYSNANPSGYEANVISTVKVNGTALTPSSKTVDISIPAAPTVNDANMVIQRNGSSIGTFTANQSSAKTINISVPTTASEVGALPDSTVIGDANITIKRNGTAIGTINANQTVAASIDVTVPTVLSDLTNDSGYITSISSSDVTTALGYTPYSNANPSGYQANVIETVKVNGTALTPSSKSVNISIPAAPTVNDSNMVIQRNGTAVGTFTANQSSAKTINISVPTTASDVGALPDTTTIPTVNDANMVIKRNGTAIGTFTANQSSAKTINISVPTQASDISALPSTTTISDLASTTQMAAIDSGVNSTVVAQVGTNKSDIAAINTLIPSAATASNQLADKAFVNSSISTNTANFIGTFSSVAELEAYSGTLTNNDYAFVTSTDTAGNTVYNRYKYNSTTTTWAFEYAINNSSFTSAQWSAINSGMTSVKAAQITTNQNEISTIKSTLNTYGNIVTHSVAEFATAAQGSLADSALQSGASNTLLTNDAGYITSISSGDVTTALGYTPQQQLVQGTGITISGNTISATGTSITIDSSMSTTSTNPVQNKVITSAIENKTVATFVDVSAGTTQTVSDLKINRVTSAEYATITPSDTELYFVTDEEAITVDSSLSSTSTNPVQNKVIYGALTAKADKTELPTVYNANMVIKRNGTAIGTFTANQSSAKTINITVPTTAADVGALPDTTVIGSANLTIKRNGTAVGTFSANATVAASVDITVPTVLSSLTNDSGFITSISSSDVTTALGYTPYSNANPSGYQANVIETVKVNGTALSVSSKAVNISIPAAQTVNDSNMVIQRNGTAVGTFTANQSSAKTINISVPTTASDVGALPSSTTIGDANLVIQRNSTAIGTFGANATSAKTINITVPTQASDIGALPDSTTIGDANLVIQRNSTAIGTFGANATSAKTINITVPTTAADVGALPDSTVIGSGKVTIKRNGTAIGTVNVNATVNSAIDVTVPTVLSALTNDSGFITSISSSDVTTALGYTPYSNANPSGYEANVINTIKVNGTVQTVSSKTVDISIPAAQTVNDANMVIQRNGTAVGTFTANQSSAKTINITVPTTASDVGALPSTTTIGNANMVIKRNGTAVGTFTANATSAKTIDISVPTTASDVGALPDSTTIGSGNLVIQRNSTAIGTFGANATSAKTINITVPTTAADVGALPDSTSIPTVVNTYSSTSTDAISGKGVAAAITGLIKKTDLSATAPIVYNNSTGVISANIDATVTASSNNLISSGAVKTYVDNAIVGGVLYQGTWTATSQTNYSGITLPVKKGYLYYVEGSATISGIEWNSGDFLLIDADVDAGGTITDVSKIDNTESTDIVRLNAAQTLTNKTIDADDNTIKDLTASNFKSGVIATSIRATASASNTILVSEKGIASALAGKANSGDIPTVNNANMVIKRNGTAIGTFTANQSSASTINITVPTTASDVGALPDTTTIPTVNNANMVIQRNGTAVGTFTANQSSAKTINISVPTTASDVGALPSSTTIGNANLVIQRNSTAIGTFSANATTGKTINVSVPTSITATYTSATETLTLSLG